MQELHPGPRDLLRNYTQQEPSAFSCRPYGHEVKGGIRKIPLFFFFILYERPTLKQSGHFIKYLVLVR